ncbi:MAG: nucleotidyltransferase domain-containing protein [Nitrospinae bacterium]|nr:nucleotidyltransferase domain-containing protein [Nitrospinota bacterium]
MADFDIYRFTESEKERVISIVKAKLEARDDIIFAYIYGSIVEPEMTFYRDIDIGIYVADMKKAKEWNYDIRIGIDIEKVLRSEGFGIPVDIRVINISDVLYVHKVIQGRLLFVKEEDLWADFVVDISKRHDDIYPLWEHFMKEALYHEY